MTLTPDDLEAIRGLIIITVQPMITEAIDDLSLRIAAAFAELHEKFDRQEQRLAIEASRNENQDQQIGQMRAALHAARSLAAVA